MNLKPIIFLEPIGCLMKQAGIIICTVHNMCHVGNIASVYQISHLIHSVKIVRGLIVSVIKCAFSVS